MIVNVRPHSTLWSVWLPVLLVCVTCVVLEQLLQPCLQVTVCGHLQCYDIPMYPAIRLEVDVSHLTQTERHDDTVFLPCPEVRRFSEPGDHGCQTNGKRGDHKTLNG